MIEDGVLLPMELAHLPDKRGRDTRSMLDFGG